MLLEVAGRTAYAYTGGRPFDPALPTVVFVHGGQQDHSIWILQTRYLAHHGYSVLAVDLPGHGRSEGPPLPTIEAMTDWLLRLLDVAGVARAAIVGHSMGSLIAIEAAGSAPERVARVALVGTAFPMKVSDALLAAAREDEASAFDMINLWSRTGVTHRPGCPGPGFSVLNQGRRLMERQKPGVLFNDFNACNAYEGGLEQAKAMRCPALFVLGARDLMTPLRAARSLIDAMPDTRLVEIPGCGHAMTDERPDAVLAALRDFLAGMERPAPAEA